MNRREFLTQAVGCGAQTVLCQRNFARAQQNISSEPQLLVKLDNAQTLATIPANFIGLGCEISSIARPGLLSSQNAVYVQLVRTLGKQGVIRVGGNTSDYASYKETGEPFSSPEKMGGSIINAAVLRDLGSFLDATGWQLIWGLNLGTGTPENAIREAKAVIAAAKNHLIAFWLLLQLWPRPKVRPHGANSIYSRPSQTARRTGHPILGDASDIKAWATRPAASRVIDQWTLFLPQPTRPFPPRQI